MAWLTGCLVKKEEGLGRPGEEESVMVTVVMLVWFCGGGEEEERWRNGGGGGGGGEDEAPCAMFDVERGTTRPREDASDYCPRPRGTERAGESSAAAAAAAAFLDVSSFYFHES